MTGGPSLTSQDLGDNAAYDLYHTLLLVMDRTRLLPDEAYLEPPDPFEDETDDQPPRPWNADWMCQDDQGHWHLDPDRADDDPDGFRTWTTTHPVMAATAGRYSIGTRYDQGVSIQGRPPERHGPGIPPGQAALALLLTAATARLVYGYSHHLPAPRPTTLAAPTRKTTQTPGTTPTPALGNDTEPGPRRRLFLRLPSPGHTPDGRIPVPLSPP